MPFSRDRQPHRVVVDTCCAINGVRDPDSPSGAVISLATGPEKMVIPYANAPLRREIGHYLNAVGSDCPSEVSRLLSVFRRHTRPVPRPRNLEALGLYQSLVGGCIPDLEVLASSIVAGRIPAITCDNRHLLSNAQKIYEAIGIEICTPDEWLATFAPALLDLCCL